MLYNSLTQNPNPYHHSYQKSPQSQDYSIPALARSRLLSKGGYMVVSSLFSKESIIAMFNEACRLFKTADIQYRVEKDTENWRGGLPPRQLLNTGGGPVQESIYQSRILQATLTELIGVPVQGTGERATYSYYCRPGDHLAIHRDVLACDISVIILLSDNTGPEKSGGELVVYPNRIYDPLSEVRDNPEEGAISVKLTPGDTCVIAGGMVPHKVNSVAEGQYRITAPMCFRVVI